MKREDLNVDSRGREKDGWIERLKYREREK